MARISEKEGEGERCELKAAQRMIRDLPDLAGKLVTADALHGQDETARAIVEQGGDYLIQIKENRKTARAAAESRLAGLAPLLTNSSRRTAAKPSAKSP